MENNDSKIPERIEAAVDSDVRPYLHSHGGDLELVSYSNGVLAVKLRGACSGCPGADLSTREYIELALRQSLPELQSVELDLGVSEDLLRAARQLLYGAGKQV